MKRIFLFIPILFLLSGCYNYHELNDLAIVSGISICKIQDEFYVHVEVLNPVKQQDASSSNESKFIVFTGKGKSLQEAFRSVTKESPRKLYGTHLEILVIDETIAKNYLQDVLDYFAREPELRGEFYVLVSNEEDILNITTTLFDVSSTYILESLKANQEYLGYSTLVTFNELLDSYLNPYQDLVLPFIEIKGNVKLGESINNLERTEKDAFYSISKLAIFKDNHFIGYIGEEDTLIYNLLHNKVKTFLYRIDYTTGQYATVEILNYRCSFLIDRSKKIIHIKVKGDLSLSEDYTNFDIFKYKNILEIERDTNSKIENDIASSIESVFQKYEVDIYGFLDNYYKNYPKEFKFLYKDRDNFLIHQYSIVVSSNFSIVEKGNLNGGVLYEYQKNVNG